METLKLLENQFAVSQAEYSTGTVLKRDGTYYFNYEPESEIFEIFESFDDAKDFGIKKVQNNPEIECYVYNYLGQAIYFCSKSGENLIEK